MISSKEISRDLKKRLAVLQDEVADENELLRLSLVWDWIFGLIVGLEEILIWDQGEIELLSSLQKFMQIRTKTKVSSKN